MSTNRILNRPASPAAFHRFIYRLPAVLFLAAMLGPSNANSAPGGELDANFGSSGRLQLEIDDAQFGRGVVRQPADGKLVFAGEHAGGTNGLDFAVLRLNTDGSLDATFGDNGLVTVDFAASDDSAYHLALQTDGKIIVAGYAHAGASGSDIALLRLNLDGTLDATFGDDGRRTLDIGGMYDYASEIAILPDGRFVVSGGTNLSSDGDIVVVRFDADGSLDTTFGTGSIAGTTLIDISGLTDSPHSMYVQADGKLIVCGSVFYYFDVFDYGSEMLVIRVNSDGSIDTGFGNDGVYQTSAGWSSADACVPMPNGDIVLAGPAWTGLTLVRLTSNGSLDTTFADSGTARIGLGNNDSVQSMILLANGTLGITGGFSTISSNAWGSPRDMFMASIDADSGQLIPGFGNDGVTIVDFGNANRIPNSYGSQLIQQADGTILATGWATGTSLALARVDPAANGSAGIAGFFAETTSSIIAEATPEFVVSVRRSGGSSGELSVDYNTVDGTAIVPGDFSTTFGTLTWTNGDMDAKSISVPITSDSTTEGEEYFLLKLSNSTGGLAASEFLVTIATEIVPPTLPAPLPRPAPVRTGGSGAFGIELLILLATVAGLAASRRRRGEFS